MKLPLELMIWSVGIVIGLPILLVILTEIAAKLRRASNPLFGAFRLLQTLVLPTIAVYFFLRKVVQLPADHTVVLVTETMAWVLGLFAALNVVNDVVFGAAKPESWRARVPSLFRDLTRLILVAIGAAIVYSEVWGKSLEGAVTALGVTSIVLGLALQEPLGNIVSGLMLLFERPINLGDWVTVDSTTGKVVEINWRSVHIQTGTDGIRVVPNSELYKKSFNNLSRPTHVRTEVIEIGFSYDAPPNTVKSVMLNLLREVPGVLTDPPPVVRTQNYADCSITYRLTFSVNHTAELSTTRDEVMTRLWYVARRNNLEIPFPMSTQVVIDKRDQDAATAIRPAELLASLVAFKHLMEPPIDEQLEAGLRYCSYSARETVVHEGGRIEGLHVIVRGSAILTVLASDGSSREVARIARGEFFGEGSVLSGQPSEVTVIAESDLELVVINPDAMFRLLGKRPTLSRELGDLMDGRKRAAQAARRLQLSEKSSRL